MELQDQRAADEAYQGSPADHAASRPVNRTRGWVIAGVVACTTLVVATIAVSSRGEPASSLAGSGAAGPVHGLSHPKAGLVAIRTATEWIDGLATGRILPPEVDARLAARDPETAKAVMAAWSDLSSLTEPAQLRQAVSWIDGLAAGLIQPTEVDSRLAVRDPQTAAVVAAAWADLGSLGAS